MVAAKPRSQNTVCRMRMLYELGMVPRPPEDQRKAPPGPGWIIYSLELSPECHHGHEGKPHFPPDSQPAPEPSCEPD